MTGQECRDDTRPQPTSCRGATRARTSSHVSATLTRTTRAATPERRAILTGHGARLHLFDTPIGRCGIAWATRGIAGVQLPEAGDGETRARLARRFPAATEGTPPPRAAAIDGIVSLLRGEARDLSAIPLDMADVPLFHRRVYEVARTIPPGETLSYGDVAARPGVAGSARAVGQALRRNPFRHHRAVSSRAGRRGKMGGFSANGGLTTKRRLLSIEGARRSGRPSLFDADGAFGFDPALALAHLRAADPRSPA